MHRVTDTSIDTRPNATVRGATEAPTPVAVATSASRGTPEAAMFSFFLVVIAAFLALIAFTAVSAAAEDTSLYERLGGYEAVSAVVDDFANKLFNDPVVGARFFGMSDDSREGFRQKNKNLVCNVTGGPCKIISRSAATTHGGLGITASEFDIVAQHLVDTLNAFKVPKKEHKELMAIIGSLRPDIVEVEDE